MSLLLTSRSENSWNVISQFEPTAISRSASPDLFRSITYQLYVSVQDSRAIRNSTVLENVTSRVRALATVPKNWDSYDTDGPSQEAIGKALEFLPYWQSVDLFPSLVLASAEGGVALDAAGTSGRRALLETLNDGTTYLLLYDNRSYCQTIFLKRESEQRTESFYKMSQFLRKGPEPGGND